MTLSDCNHLAHVICVWQIQKFYVTVPFLLCFIISFFEGNFQIQAPGGLYSEGRFNEGFFCVPSLGVLYLEVLYMEGLIFGILRYLICCFLFVCLFLVCLLFFLFKGWSR